MYRLLSFGATFLVATVSGVALGNSTVAAMQVRTVAEQKPIDDYSFADQAYARGELWAEKHGITVPDDCPEPDLDFRRGCVARSSW